MRAATRRAGLVRAVQVARQSGVGVEVLCGIRGRCEWVGGSRGVLRWSGGGAGHAVAREKEIARGGLGSPYEDYSARPARS